MANTMFWLGRFAAVLTAINITGLAISLSLVNPPGAAEPNLLLAQAQRPQQGQGGRAAKAANDSAMARCIAAWDRGTQMSKQEWRASCERTVKEYPALYSKPF